MFESWIIDVRYAGRRLLSRPTYALLAVLTLALGAGGTAAIFSVARTLLLDPLPIADEDRVAVDFELRALMCLAGVLDRQIVQVEFLLHLPQQLLIRLVQADPDHGVFAVSPLSSLFNADVAKAQPVLVHRGGHDARPSARRPFGRVLAAITIHPLERHAYPSPSPAAESQQQAGAGRHDLRVIEGVMSEREAQRVQAGGRADEHRRGCEQGDRRTVADQRGRGAIEAAITSLPDRVTDEELANLA